jgi:hypothetical protein
MMAPANPMLWYRKIAAVNAATMTNHQRGLSDMPNYRMCAL